MWIRAQDDILINMGLVRSISIHNDYAQVKSFSILAWREIDTHDEDSHFTVFQGVEDEGLEVFHSLKRAIADPKVEWWDIDFI